MLKGPTAPTTEVAGREIYDDVIGVIA